MENLIIVESPTKARTLARYLGSEFRIEATMGHIRDLPAKKLGVEIREIDGKNEFIPDYQVIPERKIKITEIKKLAAQYKNIILATDPDREGEAIAFHIKELLKNSNSSFQRIVFHEITNSAITEAIKHPRDIDKGLFYAQQARRILDRLVGYKLSPLLWNKLNMRWLSAGRVQSVCVRLIVDREREISSFKAIEYWIIDVELAGKDQHFIARLVEVNDKKAEIASKDASSKIIGFLQKAGFNVWSIETKEVKRYPSPPFTTSTMQQTAANRFGWSAKKTMRTAQELYEEGYITYHRTDSTNLSGESIDSVRNFIASVYSQAYLPQSPKYYKTKSKVAQEAHEAIRPTNSYLVATSDSKKLNMSIKGDSIKQINSELGRDLQLLYSLIWRRFVASQMNEAVFNQTRTDILAKASEETEIKTCLLRTVDTKVKFNGWLILYDEKPSYSGEDEKAQTPKLSLGEKIDFIKVIPQQKFTEPPARFNEASLIKVLEEKGIGRPSTYAPIISTIQDRKYVEKIEKKFHPTVLGISVNDFLIAHFPEIFDILFTARMEDELDDIANGNIPWQTVLHDFYIPFKGKLDSVFKTAQKVKVNLGETDEKCPNCGRDLLIKMSKYGKFFGCSGFPECKFTRNMLEKAGLNCPLCKGDIIVKRTRRGKQFYGCGNYPHCKFAAWKKEDIK